MKNDEKQLLEKVNAYCSYSFLVVTICFCALIYWGNHQLNPVIEPAKVDNKKIEQMEDSNKVLVLKASYSQNN